MVSLRSVKLLCLHRRYPLDGAHCHIISSNSTLLPGESRLDSSDMATFPLYSGFSFIGFSRLNVKDVIGVSIECLIVPLSR